MKKVLLAFSGGLDTSYCARYLAVDKGMDVHSVIVDTGGFSDAELANIEARAHACKVSTHTAINRTQELYDTVLRHCIAGNILKNGTYPLSVSAERVVQAMAIAEHAQSIGATHIAHGSTAAGNDQIRFDMIFRILCPEIVVLTPIRDKSLSRQEEIDYLTANGVQGEWNKAVYSINQGIWGTTIGGSETLTSHEPLPEHAFPSHAVMMEANAQPRTLRIGFEQGQPCSVDGTRMSALAAIQTLNDVGTQYGIGRGMHVGDTIIGIKGRVAFEAPAALMLIQSHHMLEKHVLTKWQLNLKDQLALWYGQLLHEGQFLEPALRSVEAFFDDTQKSVTGEVHLSLAQQAFAITGVTSAHDLMQNEFASYGEANRIVDGDDAKGFAAIAAVSTIIHRSVGK